MDNIKSVNLRKVESQDIYEEAARRLKMKFTERYGNDLSYGEVKFVFHKCKFVGIEMCPRLRLDAKTEQPRGGQRCKRR